MLLIWCCIKLLLLLLFAITSKCWMFSWWRWTKWHLKTWACSCLPCSLGCRNMDSMKTCSRCCWHWHSVSMNSLLVLLLCLHTQGCQCDIFIDVMIALFVWNLYTICHCVYCYLWINDETVSCSWLYSSWVLVSLPVCLCSLWVKPCFALGKIKTLLVQ